MPTVSEADVLVAASDCLEAMSEALLGVGGAPKDARDVLQRVLDLANRLDDYSAPESELESAQREFDVPSPLQLTAEAPAPQPHAPATGAHAVAAAAGEGFLRVPADLIDELLRLVGETMIANTQIKEQLRQSMEQVRTVVKQNFDLEQLAAELEQLIDVAGVTMPQLSTAATSNGLDALEFDRYNELHTVSRRLIEAATDARELSVAGEQRLTTLADLLDDQRRLAVDNQNAVMKTRLVPVASIVSRLQRSVRQTARVLDKAVELTISGDQTPIDGNVLNALVDPLMHLLRNAVDHGIETSAQRTAVGKSATGRIALSFAREGSMIVVRCSDDGAGLDLARIRAKAVQRGMLAPDQPLSDDDTMRLILMPGFSTRDETTQVSGRGVGMDVVYSKVLALKGQLRLFSQPQQGLTVELRLPASLLTTHGLLVRIGEQVLAISSYGIEDIRYVSQREVQAVGRGYMVQIGDRMCALDRLDALLGLTESEMTRDWFPALMVQTDGGTLRAVRVQEVLDTQEIVIKRLGRYMPPLLGVSGITVLGNGSIAAVIDLPQLLRAGQIAEGVGPSAVNSRPTAAASRSEALRTALVVDDSLSARRAAAQFMRDAGFLVRTAIDGLEAVSLLTKGVPDIVLVDMEMPRMNGLEFTSHLRGRPETRQVPVIMITSRSTEKHRRLAEKAGVDVYLTKPFSDDVLMTHIEQLLASSEVH